MLLTGLLLAACSPAHWELRPGDAVPPRPDLPDTLYVAPLAPASDAPLTETERALLHERLAGALQSHRGLRLVEQPPSGSAAAATVTADIGRFDVRDRPTDAGLLRTIQARASLRVASVRTEEAPTAYALPYTYQRLYPGGEAGPLAEDRANAVGEIAGALAWHLWPTMPKAPVALQPAGPDAAQWAHPSLLRGNRFAEDGRFDEAARAWRLVLFDPRRVPNELIPPLPFLGENDEEPRYQVSPRSMARLQHAGVDTALLARLQPLLEEPPLRLADFRTRLAARQLDPALVDEARLIALAEVGPDRLHRNLAAAHANLGAIYRVRRRFDLAAWHLARAYAHNPQDATQSAWSTLQTARNLLDSSRARTSIDAWASLPPPAGVEWVPGKAAAVTTLAPGEGNGAAPAR